MGRQEGIIQLTGSIGHLSFYKSQDGYLARKKSGVSRKRIMTDPAYARTRENIAEFRQGALATKLIRRAFGSFIRRAADNRVTSRLTSVVMKAIKSDAINKRGQRNMTDGAVELLEGFEFNKHAQLETSFGAPYTASIDRTTGNMIIDIPGFKPAGLISAPQGTTHFRLHAVGTAIDFKGYTFSVETSQSKDLPIDEEMREPLRLMLSLSPGSLSTLFLVFGIEFLQLVNGVHHPLSDDSTNGMAIVAAEGYRAPLLKPKQHDPVKKKTASATPRKYRLDELVSTAKGLALPSDESRPLPIETFPGSQLINRDLFARPRLFDDARLMLADAGYPHIKEKLASRAEVPQAMIDWLSRLKRPDG